MFWWYGNRQKNRAASVVNNILDYYCTLLLLVLSCDIYIHVYTTTTSFDPTVSLLHWCQEWDTNKNVN